MVAANSVVNSENSSTETTYLVNENFINNFRKDFYLINTARGKCVNTKDLVVSIKNGKIKGTCLDVLEYEKTSFENLSENGFTEELQYLIDSEGIILGRALGIRNWSSQELMLFIRSRIEKN